MDANKLSTCFNFIRHSRTIHVVQYTLCTVGVRFIRTWAVKNTLKHRTAILHCDGLYFLWHGINNYYMYIHVHVTQQTTQSKSTCTCTCTSMLGVNLNIKFLKAIDLIMALQGFE